ncbi:MAG: hypothetical protein JXR77_16690 [Lentisphaeria bacterium]|nr:hypothetical protein [Lentisphaeria bacterium]
MDLSNAQRRTPNSERRMGKLEIRWIPFRFGKACRTVIALLTSTPAITLGTYLTSLA